MATVYNVKIKTVSAFNSYNEKYIENMFSKFLDKYRDEKTNLGFENTEIKVEKKIK